MVVDPGGMVDTTGGGRGRDWKASLKSTGPMDIEEVERHPRSLSCIRQGLRGTASRLAQEDPVGYLGTVLVISSIIRFFMVLTGSVLLMGISRALQASTTAGRGGTFGSTRMTRYLAGVGAGV